MLLYDVVYSFNWSTLFFKNILALLRYSANKGISLKHYMDNRFNIALITPYQNITQDLHFFLLFLIVFIFTNTPFFDPIMCKA